MTRILTLNRILVVVGGLGVFVFLLTLLPDWFWHPLGYCTGTPAAIRGCKGYNSWSGSFSDIGEITLVAGVISGLVATRRFFHLHFECHEETCHKLGVHPVRNTPYRTCWHHHPVLGAHEKHGVPLEHIHKEWRTRL